MDRTGALSAPRSHPSVNLCLSIINNMKAPLPAALQSGNFWHTNNFAKKLFKEQIQDTSNIHRISTQNFFGGIWITLKYLLSSPCLNFMIWDEPHAPHSAKMFLTITISREAGATSKFSSLVSVLIVFTYHLPASEGFKSSEVQRLPSVVKVCREKEHYVLCHCPQYQHISIA